jgi:hypothetical protein
MTRFHVFCFYVHRLHSITKIARVKYLSNLNFIIRDYAEALRLKYLKYFALQTKTDKFLLHLFASSALCSYIYTYACIFISIFIFRFFFFFHFFFIFFSVFLKPEVTYELSVLLAKCKDAHSTCNVSKVKRKIKE